MTTRTGLNTLSLSLTHRRHEGEYHFTFVAPTHVGASDDNAHGALEPYTKALLCKRALYICKRALYIRKRALYTGK